MAKTEALESSSIRRRQTIIYPVVTRGDSSFEISKNDFRNLETEGGVTFDLMGRKALRNIAHAWVDHDLILHSPRSGKFRRHLSRARRYIEQAHALLDLTRENASAFDRQLSMWILNQGSGGASVEFFVRIGELPSTAALIARLEARLPRDGGAKRPYDDQRYIIWLADEFERAGGRAVAYRNVHAKGGYADKPFRRFVQAFYQMLSLKAKRPPNGLDEAITQALKQRRRRRTKKQKMLSPKIASFAVIGPWELRASSSYHNSNGGHTVSKPLEFDRLLYPVEVAKILGVSLSWLAKARLNGTGPAFVKIGRAVRYGMSAVQAFIDGRRRKSTSEPPTEEEDDDKPPNNNKQNRRKKGG